MNRASTVIIPVLLLFLLVLPRTVLALGGEILPPYPLFSGDAGRQEAHAMAVGPDGSVAVTGYRNQSGDTNDDFYTVLFRSDGSGAAWSTPAVLDLSGGSDRGVAVAIDSSGDVIVSGYVTENGKRDIVTVKYEGSTGSELWRARYNGPANGHDIPVRIALDDRDNVYVGANSQNASGNNDILILKYAAVGPNADGTPLWSIRHDGGSGADELTGVAVAAGHVAATGYSWNGTDFDMVTLKYTEEGAVVWTKRESSQGSYPDWGKSVAIDPSGNVVATGFLTASTPEIHKNIVTIKYGDPPSGSEPVTIWRHEHDGGFDDEPVQIALQGGAVYLTGVTTTLSGVRDILTFRLSDPPSGLTPVLDWLRIFHSSAGENDEPVGLALDGTGSLYVCGTASFSISNSIVLKYRAVDGTPFWSFIYSNPDGKNNGPIGIGVSADDGVFVAGSMERQTSFDIDFYLFRHDPGFLNPPTSLAASPLTRNQDGTYSVTLSWTDNADNESEFVLERREGSGEFQQIFLPANSVSYTDPSLAEWTRYEWRVKARSLSQGDSHYSNTVKLLALLVTPLPPSWTFSHNGIFDSDEYATAIAVGSDGNPVVTGSTIDYAPGYTSGTYSSDYLTVKLSRDVSGPAAGEGLGILWKYQFEGGFNQEDEAKGVTIDTQNRVIVTGNSMQDIGSGENINSIVTLSHPGTGGPPLWVAQFNGPAAIDDRVRAVTSIRDGSDALAVIGHGRNISDPQPSENVYLIKYPPVPLLDPQGRALPEWSAQPLDLMGGNDFPSSVSFDPDGNILVSGYGEVSLETGEYRSFVVKYCGKSGNVSCNGKNPGEIVWLSLRTDITSDNRIRSMTLDPSGNIYAAGFVATSDSGRDMMVAKYSGATGQILWSITYRNPSYLPGDDEAISVRFDPIDGRIVVAGNSDAAYEDSDITILSLDAATGAVKWVKSVPSSGYDEFANDMTTDLSGNIFVVGSTTGPDLNTDSLAVKFDFDGNILGRTILDYAGGIDEAVVAVTNGLGELFVAGYGTNGSTGPNGNNTDLLVYKVVGTTLQVPWPVSISEHYTNLEITWTDNAAGEAGYELERKNGDCPADVRTSDPLNPWVPVNGSPLQPDSSVYTDTGLSIGQHYCYRLRAFASNGETTRWIPRQVVMSTPVPPPVLSATPLSTTSVRLSWSDVTTNEEGYFIERCTGTSCTFDPSSPDYRSFTTPANATTHTDGEVCTGAVYRYRIQAFRTNEWRSAFTELSAPVAPLAPQPPGSVTATALNEREILLSWSRVSTDEEGYRIRRCVDQGGECTDYGSEPAFAVTGQVTSAVDNPMVVDGTVRYRISAFKGGACSWETPLSAPVAVQTGTSRPTISAGSVTTTSATIQWNDSLAHETGYRVERCSLASCTSDSDFTPLATLPFGVTSFSDTSLCQGSGYGYRVRGIGEGLRGSGGGSWTRRVPVTVTNFRGGKLIRLSVPFLSGMKSDFSDIRFVDEHSRVELPYWIESKVDGSSAQVWLVLGQSDRTALYFGNPSASAGSLQWATLGRGLAGFWPFNETTTFTSGTIADVSGNGMHASAYVGSGGITAAGRYGNALSMAGQQSVRVWENGKPFLDLTGSLTLELWYQYQPSPDWARLLSKPTTNGVQPWDLYEFHLDNTAGNQKVNFRVVQNNTMPSNDLMITSAQGLQPGQWYHIVGRYDVEGRSISLFINGVEQRIDGITPFTIATNDESLGIGTRGGYGNHAYGVLDEVRIYNAALPTPVILSHYTDTVPTASVGTTPETGTFAIPAWEGSYSDPAPYLTVNTPILPAPTAAAVSYVSESEADISWSYPSGGEQTGFAIDRCADAGCSTVLATLEVTDPAKRAWRDTGLSHETVYHYRVRAVKSAACRAESSPVFAGSVTTTLRPPVLSASIPLSITYDCSDLRLFDADGVTPVPFWVESCNTPVTRIWTKWSSLSFGSRQLFLYYGNPLAGSVISPPSSIFTLFDDFDGSSIDTGKWTIADGTGFSVSGGNLVGTHTAGRLTLTQPYLTGYTTESRAKVLTHAPDGEMIAGVYFWGTYASGLLEHPGGVHYRNSNAWTWIGPVLPLDRYRIYGITMKSDTRLSLSVTDPDTGEILSTSGDLTYSTHSSLRFALGRRYDDAYASQSYHGRWDWVRVRRYLDPTVAPVATPGSEETGPFAGMAGWLHRRPVTLNNPGTPLAYTPPDGYQISITLDTTPMATDTARISWTDTTGSETGFVLERCVGGASVCTAGSFTVEKSHSVAASSPTGSTVTFNDRVMEKGTDYCYRVKAVRSSGWVETGYSDVACVRSSAPPSPPVLSGTGYESRIDLSWSAADTVGESGFEIDRCSILSPATDCSFETGRDPGFPKAALPNATGFQDSTACGTYKYRVRSFKEGASVWPGWSNEVILSTTPTTPPSTITAAIGNDLAIRLTWTDTTSDEGGFEVQRCSGSGCDFSTATTILYPASAGSGSTVTVNDQYGVVPGVTYRYRVRGVKSGSSCGWPTPFTEATADLLFNASPPTKVTATPNGVTQGTVSWTDTNQIESGFRVERCSMSDGYTPCNDYSTVATTTTPNGTSWVDTGVCPSSAYRYRVSAVGSGNFLSQAGGGCWTKRMKLQIGNFRSGFITRVVIPRQPEMKSDYSDLRFFDAVAVSELPYWIDASDGSSVTIWVRLGANDTVYLYYGNPQATAVSSVTGVFGTSLKGYWPFSQPAGTVSGTLTDVSGNGNHPVMNNFALPNGIVSGGPFGNALSLDGINDMANKGGYLPGFPTGNVMSVEAWVYPKGFSFDYNGVLAFGFRYPAQGFGASFGITGKPQLPTWNNDFFSNGDAAPLNQWSHVVWVLNGKNVTVYVNGVKTSGSLVTLPNLSSYNLSIGSIELNGGSRLFNGMIDELRIYNAALTDADVAARYAPSMPVVTPGEVESGTPCMQQYVGTPSQPATMATYTPGNLFTAGDMEGSVSFYRVNGTVDPVFDTNVFFSGKRSVRVGKLATNATDDVRFTFNGTFVQGQPYQFRGYLKTSLSGSAVTTCKLFIYGKLDSPGFSVSGSTDWLPFSEVVVMPSASSYMDIYCRVQGAGASGSAWFDMFEVAPYAPVLTATPLSEGVVKLSWTDQIAEESGYRIQRCEREGSGACSTFTTIAEVGTSVTEYRDVDVRPGWSYTYRVQAYLAGSCGWTTPWSNEQSAVVAPSAPTAVTAAAVDTTTVSVSWQSDATTETGFIISRSESTNGGASWSPLAPLPAVADAGSRSYRDTTACPGVSYRYTVKSFKNGLSGGGGGCWTRKRLVTISPFKKDFQVRLTVPYDSDMRSDYADLRFYDPTSGIQLPYWIESKDGTQAVVWVRTNVSPVIELYYGNPQASPQETPKRVFDFYDDFTGSVIDTTLWVKRDTAGLFSQSDELIKSSPPAGTWPYEQVMYGIPQFQRPFIMEGSFLHSLWPEGVSPYYTYVGVKNGGDGIYSTDCVYCLSRYYQEAMKVTVLGTNPSMTGVPLSNDTWYSFRIDVKESGAEYLLGPRGGALSSIYTTSSGTEGSLRVAILADNRPHRFDSFRVRRYAFPMPAGNMGNEIDLGGCATFSNQWTGPESTLSNTVTPPVPQPPVLSSVNAASDVRMDLAWSPVNIDQSGFRIRRCQTAEGTCEPLSTDMTAPAASTSWSDTTVTGSTRYCYRVEAYKNAACTTGWENAVSGTLCDTTMPAAAAMLTATPLHSRAVRLDWIDNATDEEGYQVQILVHRTMSLLGGIWSTVATLPPGSTSYIHSQGIEPGHSYSYRVRPFRGGDYSPFAGPAYVTLPFAADAPAPNSCP